MTERDGPVEDAVPAAAAPPGPALAPVPSRRFGWIGSVARQLGIALLTLFVISLVTFAATNYKSPEEVARAALGREAAKVQLDAYLKEHGRYSRVNLYLTTTFGYDDADRNTAAYMLTGPAFEAGDGCAFASRCRVSGFARWKTSVSVRRQGT